MNSTNGSHLLLIQIYLRIPRQYVNPKLPSLLALRCFLRTSPI